MMKKQVMLIMLCILLAATGLAGCSEEKEPIKAVKETREKQENYELAKDFEDETKTAKEVSTEVESFSETQGFDTEKVDVPEIQVQAKQEVKSQEVTKKDSSQEQKETPEKAPVKETPEKKKQEQQKVETPEEKEEPKDPKPEPPRHTHSWEPVYAERQVEMVKLVPWTKCYCCGADMTGNVYHIDEHLLNGESNVHYGTEYREETYYETERYVSGYSCSCGKTKTN